MDQSKNRKLLVLAYDNSFANKVETIVGEKYISRCILVEDFNDLKNHFFHSIPPDGIIVQYSHSDYQTTTDFLKTNELDITLAAISEEELAPKLEAFFLILAKWSSRVVYLPIHSVLASFIGYTPVDLFHKKGPVYQLAIQKKSFIPETESNEDGFLYLIKDDLLVYEQDWKEATLAYFKSNSLVTITQNGPMGLLIPFLESTSYHGIPETDKTRLFSALERISCLLHDNPELSELISRILYKNKYQLKHTSFLMCMNIATLSALDIGSTVVYFNITFAALVHDLGTLQYGFEEYEFNDFAMEKIIDENLISKYSRHAEASLSLLVKNYMCPSWVAEMVLSHHESDSGFGYPMGVHSSSLSFASFIFSFNHEWSEKVYGYMAKEKSKIDRQFFIKSMPEGSEQAKNLKAKLLKHLNFTPQ